MRKTRSQTRRLATSQVNVTDVGTPILPGSNNATTLGRRHIDPYERSYNGCTHGVVELRDTDREDTSIALATLYHQNIGGEMSEGYLVDGTVVSDNELDEPQESDEEEEEWDYSEDEQVSDSDADSEYLDGEDKPWKLKTENLDIDSVPDVTEVEAPCQVKPEVIDLSVTSDPILLKQVTTTILRHPDGHLETRIVKQEYE